MGARRLLRHVGPRQRGADVAEAVRGTGGRLGIELEIEGLAADQVGEARAGSAAPYAHRPVGSVEVGLRAREPRGGERDQRLTRRRRGLAELHAAAGDPVAAAGRALIGRERAVPLDHGDAVGRHAQLVAGDLAHGDAMAGAEVDLADEDRDGAVAVDGEIGVHRVGRQRLAEEAIRVGHRLRRGARRPRKAHDEGAARGEPGAEKAPAREGHLSAHPECRRRAARRGSRGRGCRSGRGCRRGPRTPGRAWGAVSPSAAPWRS